MVKKYNLEDILENPLYIAGFYAQLYGWADNVSAHSALQWLTPEILYSVISHNTRALPNGFESLWKKIAYYYELDIRYNTEVLEVIQNTQVSIKCKNKKIYTGNDVFICSDFSLYKHPLTNKIGEFEHTNVYSSRMYVDSLDDKIKEVAPYYVIDPDDIEKYEVEVSTIRNYGKNKKGKYICAACSYLGNITDIKKTRKQMRDKLKVYGINSYKIIELTFKLSNPGKYLRYIRLPLRTSTRTPLFNFNFIANCLNLEVRKACDTFERRKYVNL